MIDFANKTVAALRADAKEMAIVGYSKMRKVELISALEAKQKEIDEAAKVEKENDTKIRPRKLNRHQRRRAEKLARMRAKSSNFVTA